MHHFKNAFLYPPPTSHNTVSHFDALSLHLPCDVGADSRNSMFTQPRWQIERARYAFISNAED